MCISLEPRTRDGCLQRYKVYKLKQPCGSMYQSPNSCIHSIHAYYQKITNMYNLLRWTKLFQYVYDHVCVCVCSPRLCTNNRCNVTHIISIRLDSRSLRRPSILSGYD